MKDIEKLFKEKLKNHQVAPAPQSWERLQQQMQAGGAKHRVMPVFIWRAAAVVLLVAGAFLFRHFYVDIDGRSAGNIAQHTEIQKKEISPLDTVSNKLAKDDGPQKKSVALAQPKDIQKNAEALRESHKAKQQKVIQKQPEAPEYQPVLTQVPKVASQQLHSFDIHHLTAVTDEPSFVATTERHIPVSVIYKGQAPADDANKDNKVFAFLHTLKSSNISISEIREAKNELVTKAFSSLTN